MREQPGGSFTSKAGFWERLDGEVWSLVHLHTHPATPASTEHGHFFGSPSHTWPGGLVAALAGPSQAKAGKGHGPFPRAT